MAVVSSTPTEGVALLMHIVCCTDSADDQMDKKPICPATNNPTHVILET